MPDQQSNPDLPGQKGGKADVRYGTSPVLADIRNADLTFATGDAVGYVAGLGTPAPVGFEDPLTPPYSCLGWLDVTGYTFKNTETTKDIGAAGTLSAIRTVITGGSKEISFIALESMNPYVRALFDDVNPALLIPSAGHAVTALAGAAGSTALAGTGFLAGDVGSTILGTTTFSQSIADGTVIESLTGSGPYTGVVLSQPLLATLSAGTGQVAGNQVSYVFPTRPSGNEYAFLFDTLDGDKKVRSFAPQAMITTRGDDVYTQADIEMLSMTATLYPAAITLQGQPAVQGVLARYIDYGDTFVGSVFV